METITYKDVSKGESEGTESFVPFSQRTLMTHAPTIYEELIQKYEGDIRNHIRIEQQMKLHSDSVINKLEDREKQHDKIIDQLKEQEDEYTVAESKFKNESKGVREENSALKSALERKIELIISLETSLKEAKLKFSRIESEMNSIRNKPKDESLPLNYDKGFTTSHLQKTKYKVNSANPNSIRQNNSNSVQLFYSRNIKGPDNIGRDEFVIPATSTRSPDKISMNQIINNSIVFKRDGKSPYLHGELEKFKYNASIAKSKSHKRCRSQTFKGNPKTGKAIKYKMRSDHLNTEETAEDSGPSKIKDYNSMQNSILYRGSKKNKNYDFLIKGNLINNSMDKSNKRKKSVRVVIVIYIRI
jgi:hypothetical protein